MRKRALLALAALLALVVGFTSAGPPGEEVSQGNFFAMSVTNVVGIGPAASPAPTVIVSHGNPGVSTENGPAAYVVGDDQGTSYSAEVAGILPHRVLDIGSEEDSCNVYKSEGTAATTKVGQRPRAPYATILKI